MSRVAKKPVVIPKGVDIKINKEMIEVKGPKGTLTQAMHDFVEIKQDEDGESGGGQVLNFAAAKKEPAANAMAGTMRSLVQNMVTGVTDTFTRKLELVGVGYRAQVQGKALNLSLGFSHPVVYQLPESVTAQVEKNTTVILNSIDKQLLGQTAAEIRAFRPPEPYKGKGVRYSDEVVKRKETKKK